MIANINSSNNNNNNYDIKSVLLATIICLHLQNCLQVKKVNQTNQEIKQLQDQSYIGSDGSLGLSETVDELMQKQNASLQELTRFSSPLINPISTHHLTWSNNVEFPVRENDFSKVTLEERKEILNSN